MKRKIFLLAMCVSILGVFLSVPVYAQNTNGNLDEYQPLEPLSDVNQTGDQGSFQSLLIFTFKILFTIGGLIAAISIILGGITIFFSELPGKRTEAKERIWAAMWGLAILLVSWILLNTINPDLLKFDFSVENITINTSQPTDNSLPSLTEAQQNQAQQATGRAILGSFVYDNSASVNDDVQFKLSELENWCKTDAKTLVGSLVYADGTWRSQTDSTALKILYTQWQLEAWVVEQAFLQAYNLLSSVVPTSPGGAQPKVTFVDGNKFGQPGKQAAVCILN